MTLDSFLEKVDAMTTKATEEIQGKTSRIEVTGLHGKYLGTNGELQKMLRGFTATNQTDGELSKHAIKDARNKISSTCITQLTTITRKEREPEAVENVA